MRFSRTPGPARAHFSDLWKAIVARRRRLACAIRAGIMAGCVLLIPSVLLAGQLDFPPVADFDILSADGSQVIGHTHFTLSPESSGSQLIYIESRYRSREYDIEKNRLQDRGSNELPVLQTYEHSFFSPGGVLVHRAKADFRSGQASCLIYDNGERKVYTATLNLPADTYAGSALVIPLQRHLSEHSKDPVEFHDFTCVPDPRVVTVKAAAKELTRWTHYPGETLEVDVKPEFGWLDFVIAPFVPKIHAWFNPADSWNFVGGQFTRYYKGPQIILARIPPGTTPPPDGINPAAEVAKAPAVPGSQETPPAVR